MIEVDNNADWKESDLWPLKWQVANGFTLTELCSAYSPPSLFREKHFPADIRTVQVGRHHTIQKSTEKQRVAGKADTLAIMDRRVDTSPSKKLSEGSGVMRLLSKLF